MKKLFSKYAVCWAILFALFQVICFAPPAEWYGMDKYAGSFWAGYGFISAAFIGQLVCSYFALRETEARKLFYNIPLVSISYTGVILMLIFGGICMAVPDLPNWVGVIVCAIVLAFTAIAVIKASAAAEIVASVDEKVKTQTQFIKMTTVDAQNIMNRAKSDAVKAECKKVYEALRYSDPMSNEALAVEEAKITVKMDELATAIQTEADNISDIAAEIVLLVKERNGKCKVLK